jgi:hypothetical protein
MTIFPFKLNHTHDNTKENPMSNATLNGKPPRKQLSQQLDRMDGIIDCLADALPEAVADACRDGAKAAVQQAVTDLFSQPDFLARFADLPLRSTRPVATATLTPVVTPSTNSKPSVWERLKAKLHEWKKTATRGVATAYTAVKSGVRNLANTVASTVRALSFALPLRRISTIAIGVGLTTAVVCYLCPHGVSAVVGGTGAACTAAALQIGAWFRRSMSLFHFGS